MSDEFSEVPPELLASWNSALLRAFPGHEKAIERGWELLNLLSNGSAVFDRNAFSRFMHQEIAVIGDSASGIRLQSRDGDFTCFRTYFRILIYPGNPPEIPYCVHFEVCAFGAVHAILPEFRQVALLVSADNYIITQTF